MLKTLAASPDGDWLQALYGDAGADFTRLPWARLSPHAALTSWIEADPGPAGRTALIVGCGRVDEPVTGRSAALSSKPILDAGRPAASFLAEQWTAVSDRSFNTRCPGHDCS